MENVILIGTGVVAAGVLVLIYLLVKMIRSGDYALPLNENKPAETRQSHSHTLEASAEAIFIAKLARAAPRPPAAPRRPAATTAFFTDLADVLNLRHKPLVHHFSGDPLGLTDEVEDKKVAEEKKVAEDLAKI